MKIYAEIPDCHENGRRLYISDYGLLYDRRVEISIGDERIVVYANDVIRAVIACNAGKEDLECQEQH